MKKLKEILVFLLISITLVNSITTNPIKNTDIKSYTISRDKSATTPFLAQGFELIQDFKASTYFISPGSSLDESDGVYFSFKANRDGNYTLQIKNHPYFITNTKSSENYLSFDNPSGTNLWYIAYSEAELLDNIITFNFKLLGSEDQGKTWENNLINSSIVDFDPDNPLLLLYYYNGITFATNPKTGFMIMVTWENSTDLVCCRSFNNGTSWTGLEKIYSASEMGAKSLFTGLFHPRIDVGIMKNGSILIISEADDEDFTHLVYIESKNIDGSSWYLPKNVTCVSNLNAKIPKLQIDHSSGDYWLMWKEDKGYSDDLIQWAEFNQTQSLFNNTHYNNVSDSYTIARNFDFYYDHINDKFRLIFFEYKFEYGSWYTYLINWSCGSFTDNNWDKSNLGAFNELSNIRMDFTLIGYVYNGENILFFLEDYLGNDNEDLFQFRALKNDIFWSISDDFNQYELIQFYWNGKKSNNAPIENSLVKVNFICENDTEIIKNFYIFIDNENPSFDYFQQKRQYFNPLFSNITLAEIPWDILPSESCDAFLEIYSETSKESIWSQILENNWEDSEPKIFRSDTGILYVIFKTSEAGRQIIYLTKSYDMGVLWSNPVLIFEYTSLIETFHGVAKGNFVFIYIQLSNQIRYLFRSFDQGNSFQDKINIYNPSIFPLSSADVSKIIFTSNNTMFLTYRQDNPLRYIILNSNNLGLYWIISEIFDGNNSYDGNIDPNLTYDPLNNLVYFVVPMDNTSVDFSRIVNMSFSVLNLSIDAWSPLSSMLIDNCSIYTGKFDFFITRDNFTATPIVHIVYIEDIEFPEINIHYKEITSDNFGDSWSNPMNINVPDFADITFTLDDIFYISLQFDGYDDELIFKRVGKLVRTTQTSVSTSIKQIIFDGIDDFGDYIDEGNYTYRIQLIDYAGNKVTEEGWFYADYNAPNITDLIINWNIPPLPRNDIIVTVNITENTNCTTYLYYKKDDGSWLSALMNNISGNYYIATIPGDSITDHIQYYIKSTDLAGNQVNLDNNGEYYSYGMPNFSWDSEGLFKESQSYSSSKDYEITIEITDDLEYVDEVIFRYSYDEGDKWEDLELEQSSPEFTGKLDDIPGDLQVLQYKIIIVDIYGNEYELTDTREIEFYPEIPSLIFEESDIIIIIIISAIIGLIVAIGYIKLKSTSHEMIYKQIFLKDYKKRLEKSEKSVERKPIKKVLEKFKMGSTESQLDSLQDTKTATPFTNVYLGTLCGTITVFSIALIISVFIPQIGILLLSASLLIAVFGYMILMSRDITINIYLERIHLRNVALEVFQIFFMFINIVAILFVGFTIDWFRYYLIESTFIFGDASIPRLYLSIFAVFFTSLVLVGISTYIQLKKTVMNLQKQRSQGASSNLLLYLKDQNSSRLITRLGYKTIVFLVTVLLAIITTTNLLTEETGRALLIIIIPFVITSFLTLLIHRYVEMRSKQKRKEEIQLPFSDSKKFCGKCGKEIYLSNKYCDSCGAQQIFEDMFGTYTSRCATCNALINDQAKYCTVCGNKI